MLHTVCTGMVMIIVNSPGSCLVCAWRAVLMSQTAHDGKSMRTSIHDCNMSTQPIGTVHVSSVLVLTAL